MDIKPVKLVRSIRPNGERTAQHGDFVYTDVRHLRFRVVTIVKSVLIIKIELYRKVFVADGVTIKKRRV